MCMHVALVRRLTIRISFSNGKLLLLLADPLMLATLSSVALGGKTILETFPDLAADLEPVCEDSWFWTS